MAKRNSSYELTFSRECILSTMEVWDYGESKFLKTECGFNPPDDGYQFFIYNNGNVRTYVDLNVARKIYTYAVTSIKDNISYFDELETRFWKYHKYLNPYFLGNKELFRGKELKNFIDIGCKWWACYTIAYWMTYFENSQLSAKSFNRAQKMRLSNDNTVFDFNAVFKKSIKNIFGNKFKEDYIHLRISEILSKRIPTDLIQRKQDVIYYNRRLHNESFDDFITAHNIKVRKFIRENNVIKGQTAFPGNVQGRVRIYLFGKEFPDFKKNEILVSSMTMPNLLSIVKKAAAIITDEGGITCHAAIISRELGIPCIIGTRIATQVFKDGDLVEVDADKGVVRKI